MPILAFEEIRKIESNRPLFRPRPEAIGPDFARFTLALGPWSS